MAVATGIYILLRISGSTLLTSVTEYLGNGDVIHEFTSFLIRNIINILANNTQI
jgi:hypothetical protein